MEIGKLNKLIDLQAPVRVADGMGGYTETYLTISTSVWAAIWPTSANEFTRSMQTNMEVTHRIRLRYRRDIKNTWRIKFGERYFNIMSIINPNEANKILDIMCKEST